MRKLVMLAMAVLAVAVGNNRAEAVDVEGTWEGEMTCVTQFEGSETIKNSDDFTIAITQSGTDLNMNLTFSSGISESFNGAAASDPAKPNTGLMAFLSCLSTTEPLFFIAGSAKVNVDTNGGGILKGEMSLGAPSAAESCKIKAKRVSTADPGIGPCS